ncbi:hypothetical protein ACFL2V_20775 [Pseudomonadota bacterium]
MRAVLNSVLLFTTASAAPGTVLAEFDLDFQSDPADRVVESYDHSAFGPTDPTFFWTTTSGRFGDQIQNQTRFFIEDRWAFDDFEAPERVFDPTTGKVYYHILVGDLENEGFVQETYIEIDSDVRYGPRGKNVGAPWPIGSEDDAAWRYPGSASGGGTNDLDVWGCCGPWGGGPGGFGPGPLMGSNAVRIFTPDAGNGTGDPRRIITRQRLEYADIVMDFIKDGYNSKPLIIQDIITPNIESRFKLDMRGIGYEQNNVVIDPTDESRFINTVKLVDAGLPPWVGDFDMAKQASSKSRLSAGQYIYTPGNFSPLDGYGEGSGGTYEYATGSYDHYAIEWAEYIDPSTHNPWSYEQEGL